MIKIGITGSIASGKTTASKILSEKRGPLFSADKVIARFYKKKDFRDLIFKKLKISKKKDLKRLLKEKILKNVKYLKKLEKIIHPLVRKEMRNFTILNKGKEKVFYEIPLLIENKLMKNFDLIFFIKAKKQLRLKRFIKKGGEKKLFDLLNNKQIPDAKKIKFSDHVIVNESNLNILKRNLSTIMKTYV